MAAELEAIGMDVELTDIVREEVRQHPAFVEYPALNELGFADRPILLGRLPGARSGRSLLFQGHMDVVSAEPTEKWTRDPFGAEISEGRLYGRGATDMKGGIAAQAMALRAIRAAGVELAGDILFETVIDEEVNSSGAIAFSRRGIRADAAVIGEPTGLSLFTAHAGTLQVRITVPGRSAHASQKHSGVSALEKSYLIYRALEDLEAMRESQVTHEAYMASGLSSRVPIVVGRMQAGVWINTVPEQAVMEARIGFLPGQTADSALAQVREAVHGAASADRWLADHPPEVERITYHEASEIRPSSEICSVVTSAVESVTGERARFGAATYGSDMRILVCHDGIPTLLFGPGEIAQAHAIDEYLPLDDYFTAAEVYGLIALRWCGIV